MYDRIYAIYDLRAQQFAGPPFFSPNDAVAARSFGDVVRAGGNAVSQYPDDHVLVCICGIEETVPGDFGVFDGSDGNGTVLHCGTRDCVISARAVLDGDEARQRLRARALAEDVGEPELSLG